MLAFCCSIWSSGDLRCARYRWQARGFLSDRCRQKADSTLRTSRAVPHPSTNRALRRLTSEVGRDPVHSTRYGRRRRYLRRQGSTALAMYLHNIYTPVCTHRSQFPATVLIKLVSMSIVGPPSTKQYITRLQPTRGKERGFPSGIIR